jgi:hypothetical protein
LVLEDYLKKINLINIMALHFSDKDSSGSTWLGLFVLIVSLIYPYTPLFNLAFPVDYIIFIVMLFSSLILLFCPDTIVEIVQEKIIKNKNILNDISGLVNKTTTTDNTKVEEPK